MPAYNVTLVPSEGSGLPVEYTETVPADPNVEDSEERELPRSNIISISMIASSENVARLRAEQKALDFAQAEYQTPEFQAQLQEQLANGEITEDELNEQWNNFDAILAKQWQVDSVEEVPTD